MIAIAERFGMDPGAVLDNVAYAKAHNCEHQSELLLAAPGMMAEAGPYLITLASPPLSPLKTGSRRAAAMLRVLFLQPRKQAVPSL